MKLKSWQVIVLLILLGPNLYSVAFELLFLIDLVGVVELASVTLALAWLPIYVRFGPTLKRADRWFSRRFLQLPSVVGLCDAPGLVTRAIRIDSILMLTLCLLLGWMALLTGLEVFGTL